MKQLTLLLRPVFHARTLREASSLLSCAAATFFQIPQGALDESCVVVRKSTIPRAGLGLFASRPIQAGELIGKYPGMLHTGSLWWTQKGRTTDRANDYVWFLANGYVLDPTDSHGSLRPVLTGCWGLRIVSTAICRLNEPPPGCEGNVQAKEIGSVVKFEATAAIAPGEELFTWYGPNYDRTHYA